MSREYPPLPRLEAAHRKGVQEILRALHFDRPLVPQVLKHLECPGANFEECWVDVFFTLRILARSKGLPVIVFPDEDEGLSEIPANTTDVWLGLEEHYALFERAFPTVFPKSYVVYAFATRPEVALAFWGVFQKLDPKAGPDGAGDG